MSTLWLGPAGCSLTPGEIHEDPPEEEAEPHPPLDPTYRKCPQWARLEADWLVVTEGWERRLLQGLGCVLGMMKMFSD